MMDLSATLDAAGELIEGWRVIPPQLPQDPLWRTLVRIHGGAITGAAEDSLTPSVVGAYGHSRRDSVVRGFGEAIERAALVPNPAADSLVQIGRDDGLCLDPSAPGISLATPDVALEGYEWFPGCALSRNSWISVPAPLVNYPCPAGVRYTGFDPSPSGAASGIGVQAATRSALFEIVERDAFLLAWDTGAQLSKIDPDDLPRPSTVISAAAQTALRRLMSTIASQSGQLVLAEVPTAVEGAVCVAAFLTDEAADGKPRVAVGCNAHDDPWLSVLGAVQESLQLRSLQIDLCSLRTPIAAGSVQDEQSRLDRSASVEGAQDVIRWIRTFKRPHLIRQSDVRTSELIAGMTADGGDPIRVDLTHRLPERLQALGWSVVKVIPVGLQALRLDERPSWSWNGPRRDRFVERWTSEGFSFTRPDGGGPPHPLP